MLDGTRESIIRFISASERLDMRWLRNEEIELLRSGLDRLHNEDGLSLLQISKQVGKSYTKIWGLFNALNIETRTPGQANTHSARSRTKTKRTPFRGTEEDQAYMTGFANGDLTAWQVSGTAVMVTSSTTHPAFARLFRELFEEYGPVYQYPMYEEVKGYKWKVATRVDNSFQFLLRPPVESLNLAAKDQETFKCWLAGLIDSDGTINVTNNRGYARLSVGLFNEDGELLESIGRVLLDSGYHPSGPYMTHRRGTKSRSGIVYNADMWSLEVQGRDDAQRLLSSLPLRHNEKVRRRALATAVRPAQEWSEVKDEVIAMRQAIHREVDTFVKQAEEDYIARHRRGNQKNTAIEPGDEKKKSDEQPNQE